MDPLDVTHGKLRCWRAEVLGLAWCGGTNTLQALGLSVSVEFSAVTLWNYCSQWTLQVSFGCAS